MDPIDPIDPIDLIGQECFFCQRCLSQRPGRQKPYPCQPEERLPVFQGLLALLKPLFSKKRWRELRGRIKPGTHKREKSFYTSQQPKRKGGLSAWQEAKVSTDPCGLEIVSESPRIVTTSIYGPNVLARNHFPDVLEAPPVTLSEREALRLTIEDQRRKLFSTFRKRKF